MSPPDREELHTRYLDGCITDEEAAAFERTVLSGSSAEECAEFTALQDTVALITMAGVPRRTAPAACRTVVMEVAGIPAAPAAPALEKFTYLMNDEGWDPPLFPGARIKPLFTNPNGGHRVFLLELQPGVHLPEHPHTGYEECLVLRGDLINEGRRLGPGDYSRALPATQHLEVYTEHGCLCLIIASAA